MKTIKIFDTTLRDGEQSPGCSMNQVEKIEMAKQLERLGVDIMEAGFAASSPGDFNSVKAIAETMKTCTVASLARALEGDIERAAESVRNAVSPRIHTFIATSPIHMQYKLQMEPDAVIESAVNAVKYAKKFVSDVEFSAEDATRSEVDFLAKIFDRVIKAGATTINIPDTVGYTTPDEYYEFLTAIREKCPAMDNVTMSVHCHNDLGLAIANSIAAVRAGATQLECTVNGIGERAGNAALEEIAMALHTRRDRYQVQTNINTKEIMRSSRLLTRITGVKVQPNKAIVGENAFAHEAGIHQDGVLKNKATYEIMTPESIGITEKSLVLGKHSGKAALKARIEELGYEINEKELKVAFKKFKELADRKKNVYDRDIEAILAKEAVQVPDTYKLVRFVSNSGNTITATTIVCLNKEGKEIEEFGTGDGPIDAAFIAMEKIVDRQFHVEDYKLRSVTEGKDALGDATVALSEMVNGKRVEVTGRGISTDVIEASLIAYINAVNKMIYEEQQNM
ncbi:MAG: 2-isopropylmalate synthase [Firmicutes bacterium]|nr:2-isopropylmalate synthase [Bacillota bacterium]